MQIIKCVYLCIAYTKLAKYLGVYIDEHLKFDIHVYRLTAKLAKLIGWLGTLKRIVPQKRIMHDVCCIYLTKSQLRMYHMGDNENQYKTSSKTTNQGSQNCM